MNRGIKINLVIEIISMILICIISYKAWDLFDTSSMESIAKYYDNYYYIEYSINKEGNDYIVSINNNSNTIEDYYLVIDNIDINNIYLNDSLIKKEDLNISNDLIVLDHNKLVADSKIYRLNSVGIEDYNIKVIEKLA